MRSDLFPFVPSVRWSHEGASAIVALQGAHLVSWRPAGKDEALFASARSPYEAGKAIRGGVPVCFPQFADRGPLAQHGFARTSAWEHVSTDAGTATFALRDTPQTRAAWPHPFRLELAIGIGGTRLAMTLRVSNIGDTSFSFTTALHTYFAVDAPRARLQGLRGVEYLTRGEERRHVEARDDIPAADAIDRTYFAAPRRLWLHDARRTLAIAQEGFTDTVVWNPGEARAAQMADMEPGGHARMLCVEAAAIEPAITLAPAVTWTGTQRVEVA